MDLIFDVDKETAEEFRKRVYSLKEAMGYTWQEVADLINSETNKNYSESKYRKEYHKIENDVPIVAEKEEDEVQAKILELRKERVKLSDERVQANAYYRRLAREDTIKEIGIEAAKLIAQSKPLLQPITTIREDGEKVGIVTISDWHYGLNIDNFLNKYDTEEARVRVRNLLDQVKEICVREDLTRVCVVDLSDLIAGRIHLSIRLQSRVDVITQIMEVSEILSEFLSELSQMVYVNYYSCLDNHARLEPVKENSLDLESLQRITPWFLKARLANNENISVNDNYYGEDIITFEVLGHKVAGVHGDKDRPQSVVDSISMLTEQHYDLILTAHLHHFSADEKNRTVVISNSSLCGTDSYSKGLRLSAHPSQNMIIATRDNPTYCIYRILV